MRGDGVTLLIFLFRLAAGLTWTNVSNIQQVHDTVLPPKKLDSRGILSASSPLPDWSDVVRTEKPHFLEILIAVDAGISRFYSHKPERIINAIAAMMHAVNVYAYQLNIRMIVVDVVPVKGHNLSLEQFLEWRREQQGLTPHDIAILLRHRYEGGIAYVNGACKRTAVGVCGFFPEAPFEYASVFFHEMAHLLGLTHDTKVTCQCSKKNRNNCLRIDGFENDCSAQALVDLLPTLDCIQAPILPLPRTVVAICGNGVVENDEDCDCGPDGLCDNVFCEARSCQFIIGRNYLYTTFTFGMAVVLFSFFILIKKIITRNPRKNSTTTTISTKTPMLPVLQTSRTKHPQNMVLPLPDLRSTRIEHTERVNITENQLPSIVPTRPAPPAPSFRFDLNQTIPVTQDSSLPPDYTKMYPSQRLLEQDASSSSEPTHMPLSTITQTLDQLRRDPPPTYNDTLQRKPSPPDRAKKPRYYDQPPS